MQLSWGHQVDKVVELHQRLADLVEEAEGVVLLHDIRQVYFAVAAEGNTAGNLGRPVRVLRVSAEKAEVGSMIATLVQVAVGFHLPAEAAEGSIAATLVQVAVGFHPPAGAAGESIAAKLAPAVQSHQTSCTEKVDAGAVASFGWAKGVHKNLGVQVGDAVAVDEEVERSIAAAELLLLVEEVLVVVDIAG